MERAIVSLIIRLPFSFMIFILEEVILKSAVVSVGLGHFIDNFVFVEHFGVILLLNLDVCE